MGQPSHQCAAIAWVQAIFDLRDRASPRVRKGAGSWWLPENGRPPPVDRQPAFMPTYMPKWVRHPVGGRYEGRGGAATERSGSEATSGWPRRSVPRSDRRRGHSGGGGCRQHERSVDMFLLSEGVRGVGHGRRIIHGWAEEGWACQPSGMHVGQPQGLHQPSISTPIHPPDGAMRPRSRRRGKGGPISVAAVCFWCFVTSRLARSDWTRPWGKCFNRANAFVPSLAPARLGAKKVTGPRTGGRGRLVRT